MSATCCVFLFQQPVLSQGTIAQMTPVAGQLLADPLLDVDTLSELKEKVGSLMHSLTKVKASLVALAEAEAARKAETTPGAYGFMSSSSTDYRSIVFKEAAEMVQPQYAKAGSILASTPLYVPLSLSLYMPDRLQNQRNQRFRFVGGNTGGSFFDP